MQRHFGALSGEASLLIIIKRERPIIIKVLPRPAGVKSQQRSFGSRQKTATKRELPLLLSSSSSLKKG